MLSSEDLTSKQWLLACDARRFPVIVSGGRLTTARSLERNGWGLVENGASGEVLFRMSQAGCDAFAWLDELKTTPEEDADFDVMIWRGGLT